MAYATLAEIGHDAPAEGMTGESPPLGQLGMGVPPSAFARILAHLQGLD